MNSGQVMDLQDDPFLTANDLLMHLGTQSKRYLTTAQAFLQCGMVLNLENKAHVFVGWSDVRSALAMQPLANMHSRGRSRGGAVAEMHLPFS